MESDAKESSWFWLIFTTVLMAGLWYSLAGMVDIAEVSRNWPKYRCSPAVMPFASLYGHDTTQNFNYCLQGVFQGQIGGITGPFATILATMISSLMTFLKNLNSMRIMIATLVGGIVKTIQEFADRFKLLFSQIKVSFLRVQMLMKRLFGTFHSVIYMGLSAVQVGSNFADTFIFKFIDTFCFSPETLIYVQDKGLIQISDVFLNDVLADGSTVISTYKFLADGQPMVNLHGINVSTNHYVSYNGKFIEARDHPDSVVSEPWSGGSRRPLICLDTDKHTIPLNDLTFSDWDETNEVDETYMIQNEKTLNGSASQDPRPWVFQPAVEGLAHIVLEDGSTIPVNRVQVGDKISGGKVIGIGRRLVNSWVALSCGTLVTPSTLIWNEVKWVRAGHVSEIHTSYYSKVFYALTVLGTASIELSSGTYLRDNIEVHSPDTEGVVRSWLRPDIKYST
jgi:hypothetical protein